RNKRAIDFQGHLDWKRIIFRPHVANPTQRIFTDEFDIGEAVPIECPIDRPLIFQIYPQSETLLEGSWRRVTFVTMFPIAREVRVIEDLPGSQGSIAAKIKLAGADASHRHADAFELLA